MLDSTYKRSDDVVMRIIADETWLVPISGQLTDLGRIYHLNEVGSDIWQLLDGTQNLQSIAHKIQDIYDINDETASSDLKDHMQELIEAGLVNEIPAS